MQTGEHVGNDNAGTLGRDRRRTFMTTAMRAMRSAACWRILADLLLRRHLMVPQIWGRYGLARIFRLFTTVPKPFSITLASSLTCHKEGVSHTSKSTQKYPCACKSHFAFVITRKRTPRGFSLQGTALHSATQEAILVSGHFAHLSQLHRAMTRRMRDAHWQKVRQNGHFAQLSHCIELLGRTRDSYQQGKVTPHTSCLQLRTSPSSTGPTNLCAYFNISCYSDSGRKVRRTCSWKA